MIEKPSGVVQFYHGYQLNKALFKQLLCTKANFYYDKHQLAHGVNGLLMLLIRHGRITMVFDLFMIFSIFF